MFAFHVQTLDKISLMSKFHVCVQFRTLSSISISIYEIHETHFKLFNATLVPDFIAADTCNFTYNYIHVTLQLNSKRIDYNFNSHKSKNNNC